MALNQLPYSIFKLMFLLTLSVMKNMRFTLHTTLDLFLLTFPSISHFIFKHMLLHILKSIIAEST